MDKMGLLTSASVISLGQVVTACATNDNLPYSNEVFDILSSSEINVVGQSIDYTTDQGEIIGLSELGVLIETSLGIGIFDQNTKKPLYYLFNDENELSIDDMIDISNSTLELFLDNQDFKAIQCENQSCEKAIEETQKNDNRVFIPSKSINPSDIRSRDEILNHIKAFRIR